MSRREKRLLAHLRTVPEEPSISQDATYTDEISEREPLIRNEGNRFGSIND